MYCKKRATYLGRYFLGFVFLVGVIGALLLFHLFISLLSSAFESFCTFFFCASDGEDPELVRDIFLASNIVIIENIFVTKMTMIARITKRIIFHSFVINTAEIPKRSDRE
jgi:hypothetical protein